jgi:hypothetical protein
MKSSLHVPPPPCCAWSPALPGRTSGSILAVRFPCTRALPTPRTDLRLVLSVRSSSDEIGGGTDRHPDQALQARVARMSGAKSGNDQFARTLLPDYAALHPGLRKKRKWNAERRVCPTSAPYSAARVRQDAPPLGIPPRHLLQRANAAAQLRTRFLGRDSERMIRKSENRFSEKIMRQLLLRMLAAVLCPSPAISSQTGHSAGRAFSRSRPGLRS